MMYSDTLRLSLLPRMQAVVACCIVLALAGGAFSRNAVWYDPVFLWEDAARKSPQKGRIYNNIGEAYHEKKQLRKAIENYLISIRLSPSSSLDAYGNIGSMYADLGEYEKAIQVYSQLLMIDRNDAITYASRGRVYYLQGQYNKAIEDLTTAAMLSPTNAAVYLYRGKSHEKRGNRPAALQDYRTACSLGEASACGMLSTH
jgi:tetratricopeptide (TPR) repeat protein